VELAGGVGEVFPREREAQEIGGPSRDARHRARGEQAPERGLAGFERFFLDGPARGKVGNAGARGARLGLDGLERPVGIGYRALRIAKRIARLAPVGFLVLEFGAQRVDSRAQGGKILFSCRTGACAGGALRRRGGEQ
jgi:hypothetical protein